MRVRWHNVSILMLAVAVALMAARPHSPIGIFLHSMANLGPGHSADEQILGLIAWLLVTILFIVVLRALLNPHGR
jgi:hypothetical protein